MYIKMVLKKMINFWALIPAIVCAGCSGLCDVSPPVVNKVAGITINSTNIIPSINGASQSVFVTVHNHADYQINAISYSTADNDVPDTQTTINEKNLFQKIGVFLGLLSSPNAGGGSLDPISAKNCSTIAPNGSCQLKINMSTLSPIEAQGSLQIVARYVDPKYRKSFSTSQIFSQQYVELPKTGDLKIVCLGRAMAYSESNSSEYTQSLCYASGPASTQATIKSIATSSPAIKLVNTYQPEYVVSAGELLNQEVEVSGINSSTYGSGSININYLSGSNNYSVSALIGLTPLATGPLLISGVIPTYNTSVVKNGTMFVSNVGSALANISNISYPSGLTNNASTTTCSASLPFSGGGNNCTIGFNINTPSGSGIITVTYDSGATTAQNVTWYNPGGGPILIVIAESSNLYFPSTTSESYTVTITNPSTYTVSNLVQTATKVGSGSPTITTLTALACLESDGVTISGTSINPGGSCTYKINVADNVIEVGTINNTITGTWSSTSNPSNSYTTGVPVAYNSYSFNPNITVTPSTLTPQVNGDGTSIFNITESVCNTGTAPATITALPTFNGSGNSYFSITNNTCTVGFTLNAPPATPSCCTYTLQLGPVTNNTQSNITGIESTTIQYNGGTSGNGSTTSPDMNFTITPNTQLLVMITATASNPISGTGASSSPFGMLGSITNGVLTLTYQNKGTNTLTVQGVQDYNSSSTWALQSGVGSPACTNGTAVAPNATCDLVYNYNYNSYVSASGGGAGGTNPVNLTTPLFVLTDSTGAQYASQIPSPTGLGATNTIYANSTLATLTNTAVYTPANESLVVTMTLANAAGYTFGFTETATTGLVPWFYPNPTTGGTATTSVATGGTGGQLYIQTATFTANAQNSTATYTVANTNGIYTGYNIPVLFSVSGNGQGFYINPLYITNTIQ